MSMDLSVSMDVSRTQEETMEMTQEPSVIALPRNDNRLAEVEARNGSQQQQMNAAGSASNKRRKIVNSKLGFTKVKGSF